MTEYSSTVIQEISSDFRAVARRLSRTDYSQCDTNLKRFILFCESSDLISSFISDHNTKEFDVTAVIKERDWLDPFEISPIYDEEISFAWQMLKYATEQFDGDFTRLYGTHVYTSTKSSVNDEMRKFIEHIIDPLIDHVSDYLRKLYDKALKKEGASTMDNTPNFTATNSTVVIGSQIGGDVISQITINDETKEDAMELITAIKEALSSEELADKEEVEELIQQVESDVADNKKPQKGILTALKVLCKGGATVIPFVTALINLLSKF